jgi:phosphatidate cytidylyltransferase
MTRILTAAVLVPIIVWTVLGAPPWAFLLVVALVGIGAFHEFDNLVAAHGFHKSGLLGMAAGVAFLVAPDWALPILIVASAVFMTMQMRASDFAKSLPSAAAGVLGIVYIFGAWHSAWLLRAINPHWLMIALAVSWAGDTAAMYVGKAIGKNKLAPRVSPGKTQEGATASILAGGLTAVVYAYFLMPGTSLVVALLVGAIGNVAGQLGDLAESAFKRGAGVKDSGTMLPGHGGWLDRIDSSLFSVPAVYATLLVSRWLVAR